LCPLERINHGHYLADSGKYQDALNVFQIALDLTKVETVRADAHMERGAVYARFLSNPELALAEYLLVLEEYPNCPRQNLPCLMLPRVLAEMGFNRSGQDYALSSILSSIPRENIAVMLKLC
jgi:tetratricopeptide (TPR) repeat protein